MSIRVLLADDHQIVREGLLSLLESQPDLSVIAEAENGYTAIKLTEETSPSVVVMDIAMPDLNGIEATRRIISRVPGTKVIALSMYSDRHFVSGMLKAGASGYVLKDCSLEELAGAIRTVARNQVYLSPRVADSLVKNYVQYLNADDYSAFSILSKREREVLQLLSEGKSVKEIAHQLSLSVKTIETHRQKIMNKLNIHNLAKLIRYAIHEGITSLEI